MIFFVGLNLVALKKLGCAVVFFRTIGFNFRAAAPEAARK
jgi:hypothetical protein